MKYKILKFSSSGEKYPAAVLAASRIQGTKPSPIGHRKVKENLEAKHRSSLETKSLGQARVACTTLKPFLYRLSLTKDRVLYTRGVS